ncbi:hypothetical protein [Vibrio sp. D431a]|uniref:hypothetical protein n=1 Tax=Vibrio sp. D431a TaxID=2837388 RepID=UPI002554A341|nr:hypothetical protein [Vibrio sp. D431a]MDK9789960.1 hypothetical protein [Vibrio sp. D431a]
MEYIVKPERNLFKPEGHSDFDKVFGELIHLSDDLALTLAYNDVLTYAFPFAHAGKKHQVLSLPDFHPCMHEWETVCNELSESDKNFKNRLKDEVEWRVNYATILIDYILKSCNHRDATSCSMMARKNSKATFDDAYKFVLDTYPRVSLIARYKGSIVELVLHENFEEMEIITFSE